MKFHAMFVPAFLALAAFTCNTNTYVPPQGTPNDYTLSFFAARQDLNPCTSFSQSNDIYFVLRISNISDDIISENAAFPTPLNIQVFNSVGEDVFEYISSEQLPDTIHIYSNQRLSYPYRWSSFQGVTITPNTPVLPGKYIAALLYWLHSDSAVTCTLTVQ
jgi:hypothetical protein